MNEERSKNFIKSKIVFNNKIGFDFKLEISNFEKFTFVFFSILLPIIFSLSLFLISKYTSIFSTTIINNLNIYLINFLIPLIGIVILIIKKSNMVKTQFFFFYMWIIIYPTILNMLTWMINIFFKNVFINDLIIIFTSLAFAGLLFYFLYKQNNVLKEMAISIKSNKFIQYFILVIIGVATYFLLSFLFNYAQGFIDKSPPLNQTLIENNKYDLITIIKNVVLTLVIAPVIEELVYRYIIQNSLNNKFHSIIFSSLYFAYAHINQYLDWSHFIVYLPLGIISGFIYWYFKNIYVCMTIHFITNLIAFGLLYL